MDLLRGLEARGMLKRIPKRRGRHEPGGSTGPAGWELDLAPFLRVLSEYIMRGGDLNAGYLRLAGYASENADSEKSR